MPYVINEELPVALVYKLEMSSTVMIETTIGQLNFFRWIFKHHVLEYINSNLQTIEKEMTLYQKKLKNNNETENIIIVKEEIKPVIKPATILNTGPTSIENNNQCYLKFD